MRPGNTLKILLPTLLLTISGCASYRTSSNIAPNAPPATGPVNEIIVTEGALEGKAYKELSLIEVSVKKLTAFHKDPTKKQANKALIEKAKIIGADAVIKVIYKSGVGFTTWGYMDAKGTGVKFK